MPKRVTSGGAYLRSLESEQHRKVAAVSSRWQQCLIRPARESNPRPCVPILDTEESDVSPLEPAAQLSTRSSLESILLGFKSSFRFQTRRGLRSSYGALVSLLTITELR